VRDEPLDSLAQCCGLSLPTFNDSPRAARSSRRWPAEKELADEAALPGYSPKFVDRLLADLKEK